MRFTEIARHGYLGGRPGFERARLQLRAAHSAVALAAEVLEARVARQGRSIARIKGGDLEAFYELVRPYERAVF